MKANDTSSAVPGIFLCLAAVSIFLGVPRAVAASGNQIDLAARTGMEKTQLREQIDITKIQWPAPPAAPRIQMLAEFFGEKSAPVPEPTHVVKKPTWMERLAGIQREPEPPHVSGPHIQLASPYGVATDSTGRIYVADAGAHEIIFFDQDGNNVSSYHENQFVRFNTIIGLAVDDRDRLFVIDAARRSVLVINSGGRVEATFGSQQLVRPAGAAINKASRVLYVADPGQGRVAVFNLDTFGFERYIGRASSSNPKDERGALSTPTNVAIGRNAELYVSDTLNSRIAVFSASGEFIRAIGRLGNQPGGLFRPKGIAVDCDGHIWVVDAGTAQIQIFDSEGRILAHFGQRGDFPGQFIAPAGIFIDEHNRVMISDPASRRVQIFRYISDTEAAAKLREQPASQITSAQHRAH